MIPVPAKASQVAQVTQAASAKGKAQPAVQVQARAPQVIQVKVVKIDAEAQKAVSIRAKAQKVATVYACLWYESFPWRHPGSQHCYGHNRLLKFKMAAEQELASEIKTKGPVDGRQSNITQRQQVTGGGLNYKNALLIDWGGYNTSMRPSCPAIPVQLSTLRRLA